MKRRAFTLVEILVVLVIMGFLVSMVAPKLADVVGFSEDPINDANLKELAKVMADFTIQKERLPKSLVNLVHLNEDQATPDYEMLTIHTPGDESVLSEAFADRLVPTLHTLNTAEAKALRRLGVSKVRNYKHTFSGGSVEYNDEVTVAAGVEVLMAGCGSDGSAAAVEWSESRQGSVTDNGAGSISYASAVNADLDVATANTYACMDGAPYAGRIILGLDNDSELVRQGYLESSGTSPKEARRDEVQWLNYALLLPRLDDTVARMTTLSDYEIVLKKYDEDIEEGYGGRRVDMREDTQGVGDVVVVSPQGYISKEKQFRYGVRIE